MESGTSGTGSTSHEIAPEVEPGSEPEPVPDEVPPEVSIRVMEEIAEQEDGLIYCKADNAGIRVSMSDNREEDTGIVFYCIVVADSAGKEIRIENAPESATKQETVIEIGAEKITGLSDGLILVTAEAADEEGNLGECEFSFVLDTVSRCWKPISARRSEILRESTRGEESSILAVIRGSTREECGRSRHPCA